MSIIVKAGTSGNSDSVIRQFQKKVVMEKAVQEYRDRMYHKSNGERKKEMREEKARKIRRAKRLANS